MNDDQQMHYVLKDHQGSLMGLTDANGLLTESYSYDAFGRRRNAQNWSYDNITTSSITDRGYTFHEHLDEFGLIIMLSEAKSRSEAFAGNGRVYDPLVGQMLSPDPFIQQPEYSQSYNRYGYVFNNPLRFTDPSGYFASGDTTGKQQNNAESIVIRQAREDQQKERLSYNTDESTYGPGVSQLRVEGGKRARLGPTKMVLI
ncbi:MAG: RHS repeat-associated core domain-containing protein [Bacteroidales bacterium]|jgi:RHS repeat-associated protein|nr:RHS repeat-associated core domain-containing protein [Bacteroidales bacterium]